MSTTPNTSPQSENYWLGKIADEAERIRRNGGSASTLHEAPPTSYPGAKISLLYQIAKALSGIRAAVTVGQLGGYSITPAVTTPGSTSIPTQITITARRGGNIVKTGPKYIRVRLCDLGVFDLSAAGVLAAASGSTVVQEVTASKDLVIGQVEATYASLTTALAGANNDLVFTSRLAGLVGNDTTLRYVAPSTPSASLAVTTVGKAITVSLATNAGTAQVETATVVAAAGATEAGLLAVTVTAAVLASPRVVNVALTTDDNTAALVATKIRAALQADTTITTHFTVGGTAADAALTALVTAANDATLNIAWEGSIAGVGAVVTSTNTTGGVAPAVTTTASQVKTAIEASSVADGLVSVALAGGNSGATAVTALAATNLAGGLDTEVGVFKVTVTNATTTGMVLRTGQAPVSGTDADHRISLDVTHAA